MQDSTSTLEMNDNMGSSLLCPNMHECFPPQLHLGAIYQYLDIVLIVEADEAHNTGALMRRVHIIPECVFDLLAVNLHMVVPCTGGQKHTGTSRISGSGLPCFALVWTHGLMIALLDRAPVLDTGGRDVIGLFQPRLAE